MPLPVGMHQSSKSYGKAYKLQTRYTDGGRRPASATGAMTSKVKGQGRTVTWSVWAVLAQSVPVSL